MEHIAVSVIVPIYNAEPWLEECVQSILDQDFPASYGTIEVLLIDDGATDGSGALCDRLAKRDNRIKVVHQENQGLSGARNTGIDMARGRYYAFIDSDDVVRPAYLKKMYEACEAHDAYMAICAVEDVQENGKPLPEPVFTPPTQEGVFRGKDLLNDFYAPNGTYYTVAWNKLYRAEVWKLLHYPEGRLHEDDFVAHRLFWRCDKVVCLPDVLYNYRLRSGSIMRTNLKPGAFDAVDGLADRYRFYVENGADRSVIDSAYAACWRRYLFLCAKVRQNPEPQLVKAISKEQFLMQGLISYLPNCRHMKMTEKLSAARWAMMPAESLCPVFVLFVFLSHFGQYETMPWNGVLLAIGQLMVAPFLFYSGYGIMEQIKRRGIVYIDSMPRKRILKFYIHFCMALCIYLFLSFLLRKEYSFVRIIFSFTALSSIGNSNWYVFAILAMYGIVYISFKQCKKHSMTSCVVFTILYIILMDVIKDQAWWYNIILCFPAGMILSKYKDRVCSIIQKPVFFIFLVVLAFSLYCLHLPILAYEIISIAFCFLIVDVCAYKEIKNSLFHFLGQYVFEIYILQRISMNLFD